MHRFNKRSVHRAMEAMGMRANLRTGSDLQVVGHSGSPCCEDPVGTLEEATSPMRSDL